MGVGKADVGLEHSLQEARLLINKPSYDEFLLLNPNQEFT